MGFYPRIHWETSWDFDACNYSACNKDTRLLSNFTTFRLLTGRGSTEGYPQGYKVHLLQ